MPIQKPDYFLAAEYEQLALDLDLPEVEESSVSPEEARRRSEVARAALEKLRESKDAPAWLLDYFRLVDGRWPWRQAAYIAWASSPRTTRSPKTQDELARLHLGLTSDRAIATWCKKNPAILETIALLQAAPLWESRADDFAALQKGAAQAGDDYKFFPHLKLAMEMRGDFVQRTELEALLKRKGGGDLSSKTDAELAALAKLMDDEGGES